MRYRALRSDGRVAATLNRGVAVLGGMISQAIEDELIPGPNPLFGFQNYKETERELKIPTMEEERAMVTALLNIDPAVGVYAGFMGETAIRTKKRYD